MKRIGKKNLRIIAVTSMTLFSLLAVTTGVFAWFVGKLKNSEQTEDFAVIVPDGRLKNVYFHQYTSKTIDNDTLKPTSYTFNSSYIGKIAFDWETKSATYSGSPKIELQEYSPLDFCQPILMVFELNDTYSLSYAGEMKIRASTDVEA